MIHPLFIGSSYPVAGCSPPFLLCARVTRFACHSATPVVGAATATTHNRGIAATNAVAGTGGFSCGYSSFVFFPCHAVAYLGAPVLTKHTETSVNYPACTETPDHSYRNPADHTDPANRTDRIPVRMYRSFRSHIFHSDISYISSRSYRSSPVKMYKLHGSHSGTRLPVKYPPHTDPSRLNMSKQV